MLQRNAQGSLYDATIASLKQGNESSDSTSVRVLAASVQNLRDNGSTDEIRVLAEAVIFLAQKVKQLAAIP